ncbi:hypothetical protein T10_10824 [Trichinella papuae]|uniref:Uncharacterized protein n=1 Tax=Trichinella papuae TaxID=268474 RepID=A0A0V1MXR3_9BILA|nr:hypothetical protein T10_10824 [Trichinella papuae]
MLFSVKGDKTPLEKESMSGRQVARCICSAFESRHITEHLRFSLGVSLLDVTILTVPLPSEYFICFPLIATHLLIWITR